MKTTLYSRRKVLGSSASGAAVGLIAAGFAGVAARPASAASKPKVSGVLTREEYLKYVSLFNANDFKFLEYYHDDVVFELNGSTVIHKPQGIHDFYKEVKEHIKETVTVEQFIADETGIAAELPTEFRVIKDWENGFFKRPLKVGEVMRTVSFGLYEVQDRKFRRIRAARYKQIHDWRMEG